MRTSTIYHITILERPKLLESGERKSPLKDMYVQYVLLEQSIREILVSTKSSRMGCSYEKSVHVFALIVFYLFLFVSLALPKSLDIVISEIQEQFSILFIL